MVQPAVASAVSDSATYTRLSCDASRLIPEANQRPDPASYRTLGSVKLHPVGTGKKALRSDVARRVPDLDQTDMVLLFISTNCVGPAASWVSGGATAWSVG